jgi:phytoene synthase
LACLHIWGFRPPLPEQAAIDCGVAFQLTNIVRDISEDAQRGRIYLPRQHYAQHGLHEDDLLHPRQDDRLACLIEDELKRAEALYVSGWEVYHSLEPDGQRIFSMMWRTYRKLLDRLKENPRQIVTRRVRLTFFDRLMIAANHFIHPLFRRLPCPPKELSAQPSASTTAHSQAKPGREEPQ